MYMIIKQQTNNVFFFSYLRPQWLIKKKNTIPFLFDILASCLYQKHFTAHNILNLFTNLLQCYS